MNGNSRSRFCDGWTSKDPAEVGEMRAYVTAEKGKICALVLQVSIWQFLDGFRTEAVEEFLI
jgi:hypothetical protein